jgi:hypothetical protein
VRRAWLLSPLLLAACGGNAALPTSTAATLASPLALEIRPDATTPSASDPRSLSMQWTIDIVNRGSSGGSLTFVNATVRDAASGAAVWPSAYVNFGPEELAAQGLPRYLSAGGSLHLTQSLQGRLPSGGRDAAVTVAIQVVADSGDVLTQTAQANLPAAP